MTQTQDFTHPPSWLAPRVLCGSAVAAAVVLLAQPGPWRENLLGLEMPGAGVWARCGSSLIVLITALLLALCVGLALALSARRLGDRAERLAAFMGRMLACLPIAALAWGFVGVWTGRFGLPVETLMPAELSLAENAWQVMLARRLWEHLAPALLLAVPLAGEVLHAAVADAVVTVDVETALRARGVPRSLRLWRHHLRQMLPLVRVRLQGLCLVAPVLLIVIEDVLRFMGWGGWMAQAIREADAPRIALGFLLGGGMVALLCAALHGLLPGQSGRRPNRLSGVAWQPWLLWMPGLMVLPPFSQSPWLVCWFAVLLAGSAAWHDAWTPVERGLPLEAAQALGATEGRAWLTHIAPAQGRMLLAWMCAAFAQTLLWAAVACALQPRLLRELDGPLAAWLGPLAPDGPQATARILTDPVPLLQAGGGIALASLCLLQVSRIVQPRPSSFST